MFTYIKAILLTLYFKYENPTNNLSVLALGICVVRVEVRYRQRLVETGNLSLIDLQAIWSCAELERERNSNP
jgi:hypothetical protein